MVRADNIRAVYKPPGQTSHQIAIRMSETLGTKVTHSGSLDPMAEGVLVLLIGPEAMAYQVAFQAEDKDYEFDLLFGFSTDTFDSLGLVTKAGAYDPAHFPEEELRSQVSKMVGPLTQLIPSYSSKVIRGRPMFWWAREGRLNEIGQVSKEIHIKAAKLLRIQTLSSLQLKTVILKNISEVKGDFRQPEIIKTWTHFLDESSNPDFSIATLQVTVSAGTYIRAIANDLGSKLGIPSCALRILRTRSGQFSLSDCKPLSQSI